ncbi:protein yippee-like 2 isoform X2 [Denticeps clupeoides]|uniref:protein yippee-like 2 isoform X2 n=1 Tax=Denticeps clupeoides TaxID=299321 RepID=UPI0010A3168D|nr:protein yippee-like 2 isoform X2 [Denticeps clupeoides]
MVTMTRSKTFQAYLPTCHRTYSCIHCRAHLANHDELISKVTRTHARGAPSFQGSQGRAYLFNSVVNVGCGPAEERVLLTGLHAVADIYCENCKTTLGWKYVRANENHHVKGTAEELRDRIVEQIWPKLQNIQPRLRFLRAQWAP